MASKRRAAVTLPRHRATVAPAAPEAQPIVVSRRSLFAVAGVAALGATGLVATGALLRRGDGDPAAIFPSSADVPIAGRVKGDPNAPMAIVEYGDMQCPVCARFSLTTERELEATLIKSGLASLEHRHYAFLGKESLRAAEAVEAAGEQGRFFQFRDVLYTAQRGENRGGFSDSRLKQLAQAQGLDMARFNASFDSGRFAERVKAQTAAGEARGVYATPTFIVNNDIKLNGLTSLAEFQRIADRILQGKGS